MTWARIVDGVVVELIQFNPTNKYHPSIQWDEVPDNVTVGSSIVDGSWNIAEYIPYVEPVPETVGPGQLNYVLALDGKLDQVRAWVASQPAPVQVMWDRASEYRRNSALIILGANELGWTAEYVDDVFRRSSKVNP